MSRTSSFTDAKLPDRITSPVRSAKKRSTKLSHDDDVGVDHGQSSRLERLDQFQHPARLAHAECGGGFVHNQNSSTPHHCACDSYALTLSAAFQPGGFDTRTSFANRLVSILCRQIKLIGYERHSILIEREILEAEDHRVLCARAVLHSRRASGTRRDGP